MFNPKIGQAVSAALALSVTAGAQAAPPAPVTLDQVPLGNILYASGSSAMGPALVHHMLNPLYPACDKTAATPVVYTGAEEGVEFSAVSCIAATSVGVPANTKIAIIKVNGDALAGILPVTAPTSNPIDYPYVFDAGFNTDCPLPASPVSAAGMLPYFSVTCDETYPYTTSNASTGPYSELGYSDVEAAIFGLNPTNVGKGSSVDTPFGIAVSLGLYHALQAAEGKTQDDQLADMPTLSRVQLAGIFNGFVTDWTHVYGVGTGRSVGAQSVHFGNSGLSGSNRICYDGTAYSTASDCQSDTQASAAVAPHDTTIYLCELGQNSGIQQAAQIFFAGQGCIDNPIKFPPPTQGSCYSYGCTWSAALYGADQIFAGYRQSDDPRCLETHDQQGHFAISFSSTDPDWGGVARADRLPYAADWRFIRVDSYAPSNENVAAGKYDFWAQSVFYYATSGVNLPTGNASALLNFFKNPATQIGAYTTASLDLGLQRSNPTLDGGLLAIPTVSTTNPPTQNETQAQFRAYPVNDYLRGNPTRNCQPPFPAGGANLVDTPAWDPKSIQ